MNAPALLIELLERQFQLERIGAEVRYRAPEGAVDAAVIERLRAEKDAVLAWMAPGVLYARASFAQERIWFQEQMRSESRIFTVSALTFRIEGRIDATSLCAAFADMAQRHPVLRTRFMVVDGRLVQAVHADCDSTVQVVRTATEQEAQDKLELLHRKSFDVLKEPLARPCLIQVNDKRSFLTCPMHHIICDGWSVSLLWREWMKAYEARRGGQEAHFAPLTVTYADYSGEQRALAGTEPWSRTLRYWREALHGWPGRVELPLDGETRADEQGAEWRTLLHVELVQGIQRFARKHQMSNYMVLLAGFQALLYRYSGEGRFCVGTGVANRYRPELAGVLGLFVNTLAMRADIREHMTFGELVLQVRDAALEAMEHQDVPFDRVIEALNPEREEPSTPLFNVAMVLHNFPASPVATELQIHRVPAHAGDSQFDMQWAFEEAGQQLLLAIEYRLDKFYEETIARMALQFQTMLLHGIAEPETPIAALRLDTEPTRPAGERRIARPLLAEKLAVDASAAIEAEGESANRALTAGRVYALAQELSRRRIGAGKRVAVLLERSHALGVAMLATYRVGAAFVGLHAAWPPERMAQVLRDCSPELVLTQGELVALIAPDLKMLDLPQWLSTSGTADALEPTALDDDIAYVNYGGAVGGVAVPRRSLQVVIAWYVEKLQITPHDRIAALMEPVADAVYLEWCAATVAGATVVTPLEMLATGSELREWILENEISIAFVPPVIAAMLYSLTWPENSSLRWLVTGGDGLTPVQLSRPLPFRCLQLYGPSENGVVSMWREVNQGSTRGWTPLPHVEATIVDGRGNACPEGIPGELYLSGEGLAHGYINQPVTTRSRFVEARPGGRAFATGLRARAVRGGIEALGVSQERVPPTDQQIVRMLCQYSGVADARILTMINEEEEEEVAAVIATKGAQVSLTKLAEFLRGKSNGACVPTRIAVVNALPRLDDGSIDLTRVGAFELLSDAEPSKERAPESELELKVAELLGGVLRVKAVGAHANFFNLGGHSLLAVQWLAKVKEELGVEMPLRDFFADPSVAGVASFVERHRAKAVTVDHLSDQEVDTLLAQLLKQGGQ